MFAYGRMCVRILLGMFLFFCRFVRSHGKVRTHMLAFSQSRSLHPSNKKSNYPMSCILSYIEAEGTLGCEAVAVPSLATTIACGVGDGSA